MTKPVRIIISNVNWFCITSHASAAQLKCHMLGCYKKNIYDGEMRKDRRSTTPENVDVND